MTKSVYFASFYGFTVAAACSMMAADAVSVHTIKLRIGNPTSKGLLIAIVDPLNPKIVKQVQFVPSKGSGYFGGSADITVPMTDTIALRMTNLGPDKVSQAAIDAERVKVPLYLEKNSMRLLKIKSANPPGITKAYVTLGIQNQQPTLILNPKVQGVASPPIELIFQVLKEPTYTHEEQELIRKIQTCPRFGTCAFKPD